MIYLFNFAIHLNRYKMNYLKFHQNVFSEIELEIFAKSREQEELINLDEKELKFQYHQLDATSKQLPIILFKDDIKYITAIVPEYPIKIKGQEIHLSTIKIEKPYNAGILTNQYSCIIGTTKDIADSIVKYLSENLD